MAKEDVRGKCTTHEQTKAQPSEYIIERSLAILPKKWSRQCTGQEPNLSLCVGNEAKVPSGALGTERIWCAAYWPILVVFNPFTKCLSQFCQYVHFQCGSPLPLGPQ